jgi:hypothetical protein
MLTVVPGGAFSSNPPRKPWYWMDPAAEAGIPPRKASKGSKMRRRRQTVAIRPGTDAVMA